jgi:riboflavin synthase
VQGHVDGTGTITARTPHPDWEVVRIAVPGQVFRYVIEKGSVAVDGVSLTVSAASEPGPGSGQDAGPPWFEVSLIPETLARTTLGRKQPGATVNLEADMIAKYVEKLVATGARS